MKFEKSWLIYYKHSFSLHKWCFYQLFGLPFCRHPFTAEDPLECKWCTAKFLRIYSDEKNKCYVLTSCVLEELFLKLTFSVLVTPTRVAGNVYRLWGAYTPLFWVSVEDLDELEINSKICLWHFSSERILPLKVRFLTGIQALPSLWACRIQSLPVLHSGFRFHQWAIFFNTQCFSCSNALHTWINTHNMEVLPFCFLH